MTAQYLQADAASVKAHIAALLNEFPELQEDEQLCIDTLEGETDLHIIIKRCLEQRIDADTMSNAIKERQSDLGERRKRFDRKSDAMKKLIRDLMETAHLDKLQLTEATLSITKPRESVDVIDLDALPQGYFKLTKSADKTAIKASLMAGETIPGAEMKLGEPSLMIRTK